ncbi:unnamed protein product [Pleuronectes platessa]|uniref:Uncharacterized protein n=1 Tax=Pleuronectes platessa TaxID=8262 RepID=A0A9N7VAX4_PLEPL|nr:unnamed protein product [Pleuronectes platessa]
MSWFPFKEPDAPSSGHVGQLWEQTCLCSSVSFITSSQRSQFSHVSPELTNQVGSQSREAPESCGLRASLSSACVKGRSGVGSPKVGVDCEEENRRQICMGYDGSEPVVSKIKLRRMKKRGAGQTELVTGAASSGEPEEGGVSSTQSTVEEPHPISIQTDSTLTLLEEEKRREFLKGKLLGDVMEATVHLDEDVTDFWLSLTEGIRPECRDSSTSCSHDSVQPSPPDRLPTPPPHPTQILLQPCSPPTRLSSFCVLQEPDSHLDPVNHSLPPGNLELLNQSQSCDVSEEKHLDINIYLNDDHMSTCHETN